MEYEAFVKDKKTVYAVIRCIEVIDEASQKIPKEIKDKYPSIPWSCMAGMRNKMIHKYFGADITILWQTVKDDIPPLKKSIQVLASEIL
jgi:uncharacterized protein with HEPN domain